MKRSFRLLIFLCLLAALAATSIVAAQAAAPEGTRVTAACGTAEHDSTFTNVAITRCGNSVTAIGAQLNLGFFGHFEFFGPHGFIANSADLQWQRGNTFIVPINQAAGGFWCVTVWQQTGSGFNALETNCVN